MSIVDIDRTNIDYDKLIDMLVNEEIPRYLDNVAGAHGRQVELIDSVVSSVEIGIDVSGKKVEQKLDVLKREDLYSIAFFGFNSKKSTLLASHTIGSFVNDNSTYINMAKNIASSTFSKDNSCFKYFINEESWLLAKLKEAKENPEAIIGLPEVIVCPADVSFSNEVTKLLTELPVAVQRISLQKQDNDAHILSIVEHVKYDNNTGQQVVDIISGGVENSIKQIESEVRNKKLYKYNSLYNNKFAEIDNLFTQAISNRLIKYDGTTQLYLHSTSGNDVLIEDLDYATSLQLKDGEYIKNEYGKKVNYDDIKDSLNALKEKQNNVMNKVLELYKERDINTYNHVTRMCKMVDVINSGLNDVDTLNPVQIERLKKMVILHDIGKLVIPSPIIDKSRDLSPEDKEIMESHVYLTNVQIVFDQYIWSLLKSALLHHRGVKKSVGYADENLLYEEKDNLSQIVSVLDVVETLTSDIRPNRKGPASEGVLYHDLNTKISSGLIEYKYASALLNKMGYDSSRLIPKNKNEVISSNATILNSVETGIRVGK